MDSIIGPLIEYAVKPACSFAKKHISYVICESESVKELKDELKKLQIKKEDTEMRVTEARGKGEDIVPSVNQWLEEVSTRIEEVNGFLEQEKLNSDNKCGFGRCFCSIGDRYKTGKETANMLNMLKEKLQQAGEQCFTDVGIPRHSPPAPMALPPTAYSKGYASRELLLEEIIEALKVKNMIGIHGMPGVGKTVLVNRLTAEVKSRNLFDEVGIAVVSQIPDLAVIRNVIADRILHAKLDGNSEEGKKDDLYRKLSALMHEQKRVLLVLDDAWELLDLHQVGIPKPDKGFKIAMTSRHKKVCAGMGDKDPFNVRVLDGKEAWSLFREELGDYSERLDSDKDYMDLAKEMVEHVDGLPLALVTLARALIVEELPAWRAIAYYLRERSLDKIDGMPDKVMAAIKVSFDYLHDRDAQYIFLLCCLFPEDWNIEIEVLMRYGIGLGLFGNVPLVQAMNQTERLTDRLKSRNLLLRGDAERTVKMHDVTRDTALHIASEGEFDFLVKDYRGSRIHAINHDMLMKKYAISISSKTSLVDVFPQDHKMEDFSLQILRLHGIRDNEYKDFLPHEFSACFFQRMGNLKVLEMCHLEISSFPASLGPLKNNLRTMCLRNCMVKDFTKVGELTNLEILDLQNSRIHDGLYEAVQQMIGLRELNLSKCCVNELCDNLVGHLSRLEALYMLGMLNKDSSRPNITSPVELDRLSCLEVLEVQVGSPEQLTNNFIAILGKLSSFHIWVSEQVIKELIDYGVYEHRLSNKVLRFNEVTISEHLQQCLGQLVGVADIFILEECNGLPMMFQYGDDFSRNDPEFIIRGPATKTEELRHDELTLFTKLEKLTLDGLRELKEICAPSQYVYLSKLNDLTITRCKMLPFAFNNLAADQLRQLKDLSIINCEGMEEIFTIDNDTSGNSSSFEGINYEEMDDANSIVLPSLEGLYLEGMEKLKVFSAKNSSHGGQQAFFGEQVQLPRLRNMAMCGLPSCEKIWESHHPKGSFGQLTRLYIEGCKELRNIFSAAVARGLVQLLLLRISACDKLEEVVVVESRNDAEEAEEEESRIIFPQLYSLRLRNLHSLRSFCSARCSTMEFPSLNDVSIEGNIKMERFSHGSLHTPKLRDQDYLNTIVARQYERTKVRTHVIR